MTRAASTPGTQPQPVRIKTIRKEPQPWSMTDSGGRRWLIRHEGGTWCDYFLSFSNARQSWSGQEVDLLPQRMPLSLLITSSIFCPVTRRQTAWRLPWQPPQKKTCWITPSSSTVTSISCEQVPWVLYWRWGMMFFFIICRLCYNISKNVTYFVCRVKNEIL